jgi:hypothetical protein
LLPPFTVVVAPADLSAASASFSKVASKLEKSPSSSSLLLFAALAL